MEQSELGSKEMAGENGSSEELIEDESGEEDTREVSSASFTSEDDEVGIASHTTQCSNAKENEARTVRSELEVCRSFCMRRVMIIRNASAHP